MLCLVAALALVPATVWLKHLDSLRYLSLFALAICVAFVIFMIQVLAEAEHVKADKGFWLGPPSGALDFLNGLSAVSFAFTCHFNAIPVLNDLADKRYFDPITRISAGVSGSTYLLVGLIGAVTHPNAQAGDILEDYQHYTGATCLRLLFAVALFASFPLFSFEGTLSLQALIVDILLPKVNSTVRHAIAGAVFTFTAVALSIALPNTGEVIALAGAAFSIPIMCLALTIACHSSRLGTYSRRCFT